MITTGVSTSSTVRKEALSDPAYQAFLLLRTVFTVAPIVFGLDKFADILVDWPVYLAPRIDPTGHPLRARAAHVLTA